MFSRPPDLYRETTRAFIHTSGADPVLSYKLTRNVIEVAITAALSFSKLKGAVAFFSLSSL